jgi:hypothetical protein
MRKGNKGGRRFSENLHCNQIEIDLKKTFVSFTHPLRSLRLKNP